MISRPQGPAFLSSVSHSSTLSDPRRRPRLVSETHRGHPGPVNGTWSGRGPAGLSPRPVRSGATSRETVSELSRLAGQPAGVGAWPGVGTPEYTSGVQKHSVSGERNTFPFQQMAHIWRRLPPVPQRATGSSRVVSLRGAGGGGHGSAWSWALGLIRTAYIFLHSR